jgi:hypothetical protein
MWIGMFPRTHQAMNMLTFDTSHIVTNHFLHFLALDRSDPKKFQILQLIAALLGWDDGEFRPYTLLSPLYMNPR